MLLEPFEDHYEAWRIVQVLEGCFVRGAWLLPPVFCPFIDAIVDPLARPSLAGHLPAIARFGATPNDDNDRDDV
jgi:hypothetical protein